KAKAAALAKQKAKEQESEREDSTDEKAKALALAKAKAAAAAKAKAAALAKQKAKEQESEREDSTDEKAEALALAKAKAVAAAKAKAAALAKSKKESRETTSDSSVDEKAKAVADAKLKAVAAAKAKAVALAKGSKTSISTEVEMEDSPNQPLLDKYLHLIEKHIGENKIEESYINRLSKHVPTLVAKPESYFDIASLLKHHDQLLFNYLSELHGTDYESYFEIYVFLYSYAFKQSVVLKVKLDHDHPVITSLVSLWEGANWPECEAYDLLGIQFTNHPNLKRILLGEEWIGYPLRKDYEPYDVEV
uniref:NADH-quinone oxidoreductase subunit C n=1 Tax=Bacillus TaxID=1386 RepID=UPI000372206B